MKKLFTVLMLALALNFLAAAGGVGWLRYSGHLDKARVKQIREILFPPPATQPAGASAGGASAATTQPTQRLEELLAREAGKSGAEQVQVMQNSVDLQTAELDRRQRELEALRIQIELARQDLERQRQAVAVRDKDLAAREQEAQRLAGDKGFQDSLALYEAMPAAKVKQIFIGLDDVTIMNYLQAMQPRTAAKIIKEFKSPDETARMQRVLERMRTNEASAPTTEPGNAAANAGGGEVPGSTPGP